MPGSERRRSVAAWDVPTRLFKWTLVALVGLGWVSQRYGDVTLVWHKWNGYAVLVLLVFRLFWGLIGSSTARFSTWWPWPGTALRYGIDLLRGIRRRPYLGHNPIGALMIIALLVGVGAQAATGLFTIDSNEIFGGPFAPLDPDVAPTAIQRAFAVFHHNAYNYLLALIAIHVAVNLTYQFIKRDPVVAAMITGRKPIEDFADQPEMVAAPAAGLRALGCLLVATALVLGAIKAFGGRLF
jgi:cytochrome b